MPLSISIQITFILNNNDLTRNGLIKALTLGFEEGSVIAVFAVDYSSSTNVTESAIYSVLNAEVETGMLTDGVDYISVNLTSLSSIQSKKQTLYQLPVARCSPYETCSYKMKTRSKPN